MVKEQPKNSKTAEEQLRREIRRIVKEHKSEFDELAR